MKEKFKKMKSRNLGWGIFMATYWRGQVFLIGGPALKWESVKPISSYYYRGFKKIWGGGGGQGITCLRPYIYIYIYIPGQGVHPKPLGVLVASLVISNLVQTHSSKFLGKVVFLYIILIIQLKSLQKYYLALTT